MDDKLYDRNALLQAYIATKNLNHHTDINYFHTERLRALEQAFDVQINPEGIKQRDNRVLWMLFSATVDLYCSIRTPGSTFLDGSLIMQRLESLENQSTTLLTAWNGINTAATASQQAHLIMLDELFKLLWGEITTVVTSHQLRLIGFDDSQEPNYPHLD